MEARRHRYRLSPILALGLAILLSVAGLGLAGTPSTSTAHEDVDTQEAPWSREGTVAASAVGEEVADPCDPDDPANGVTNHVFGPIPSRIAQGEATFRLENDEGLDTDPSFHRLDDATGECVDLGHGGADLGFVGATETGTIPNGTEYVNVVHWAGAGDFRIQAPPETGDQADCSQPNENVWFLGIVYDAAQRSDFKEDVRNFEWFDERLQDVYCYDEDHSTILAFEDSYTDRGKTYEAGSEANLKRQLAEIRSQANQHSDAVVFLFLSSHGLAWTGPVAEDCPDERATMSYAGLLGGGGEDGFLEDCELGQALAPFDPDVRMGVFVDCSFCGGFSDSLTAASGTVPDGGVPASSGVPGEGRIAVTGCAITTECFGGGPGGGAVLYGHMRKAIEEGECDGWTAPGFPTVQGLDAPVNDPAVHGQDGTCSVSEVVFGAVHNAYAHVDPIGIQEQFRMKYGFDTLEEDLAFAPAGLGPISTTDAGAGEAALLPSPLPR